MQLNARVAIVERDGIGGDCTWTGCVPSKTLLKAAKLAHQMRHADRHGPVPVDREVDLRAVTAHVRDVIVDIYAEESPEALQDEGINVFLDTARFLDPHTLAVGDKKLRFRHALIDTGDCLGSYQFTHYAGLQAFMAARNALLPGASDGTSDRVPWITFTDPEVAHVGLTEKQARNKHGQSVMTCVRPMEHVDRA